MLTAERKDKLRQTVLGGAMTTHRLTQALPDAANLGLRMNFLNQKYFPLICFTDPEIGTVEEWKEKARTYKRELTSIVKQLEALTV